MITTSKLLNREQAANFLGVRPQTLACWACSARYSLPFVRIGRRVMYRISDLEQFITDNVVMRGAV